MYSLGQYLYGCTPVHRLDPRTKIIAVVALSILILRATPREALLICLFLALAGIAARLSLRRFGEALRPLVPFLVLLFRLHLFFTEGHPLVVLFPGIAITQEGLHRGLMTAWQFAALVAGASILTMTTSPSELISGIERLMRPLGRLGVSSHDIATMISLALRFVPTLLEEVEKVRKAQLARGADLGRGGVSRRVRALSALSIPIALGAIRRAEDLARAMEGRGYGRGSRTYMRELRMAPSDYAAVLIVIALFTGCFFPISGK